MQWCSSVSCSCRLQALRTRRDVVLMAVVRNGHALQLRGSEGTASPAAFRQILTFATVRFASEDLQQDRSVSTKLTTASGHCIFKHARFCFSLLWLFGMCKRTGVHHRATILRSKWARSGQKHHCLSTLLNSLNR